MKKRLLFLLVCILTIFIISACSKSIEAQVSEQLELGQKYMTELNYEQAIVAFKKAIELDPKNTGAYISLADAYVATGQHEDALAVLQNIPENVGDVSAITDKIEEIKKLLVVDETLVEESSKQQNQLLASETLVVETETEPLDETELKAQEIRDLFNDYDNIENYLKPDELTFYGHPLVGMDIYGIMDVMRERGLIDVDESFMGETTYYWVHGKSSDDYYVPQISAIQNKRNPQDFLLSFDFGIQLHEGETAPSYDVGIRGICLGDSLQTVFDKLGYKEAEKMSIMVYECMDKARPESVDISVKFCRLILGEYENFLRYSYNVWYGSDYPFDIEMLFRYDQLEEITIEFVDEWIRSGMYENYIRNCEELDKRANNFGDIQ